MSTQQANVPKILLLAPKGGETTETSGFDLDGVKSRLSNSLGVNIEVIGSAEWFAESFSRCGSDWEAWAWETVLGKSFSTRAAHFNGFAVLTEHIGRTTAMIVNLALRNKKAVLLCCDGKPVGAVTSVVVDDPNDWKFGWSVTYTEL